MSSTKPNYKKPSLIEILKIYGYVFKLNIQKQKRDYDLIDQGYNSGLWNKKFEEIDFESPQGNYSRTDSEDVVVMCYEGKMVKAKMQDFLMKHKSEFLEFFDEFDKMQTIVELGCGLGFNLFNLHRMGFKKLEGYDLSKNSIENLQKYVKMNDYDMYFDRGIDDKGGWLQVLKDLKIATDKGAWYAIHCNVKEKKFLSKDFGNIIGENDEFNNFLYDKICENSILKYQENRGIDDVEFTDEVINEDA